MLRFLLRWMRQERQTRKTAQTAEVFTRHGFADDAAYAAGAVIAAVMLVIGLGLSDGIALGNITISGTAIAAVLGVILAKVLPKEDMDEKTSKTQPDT